ncbi:MAG: hypothetical protein C0595_00195 [Marinilabiliales bacterium]|nr:MAG: hypothetical protein C0595_00195 [Marinilabiliales bacterium]
MLIFILGFVLLVLGFQVFPVCLGNNFKSDIKQSVQQILIHTAIQLIMLWLGLFLGDRFLYLSEDYQYLIIFIGLLMVGLRISFDSFAVRRGDRTFTTANSQSLILASTAQSINTFLAGIILSLFNINHILIFSILGLSVLLFSTIASWIKLSKTALTLASLVYILGGIGIVSIAIYLGFFIK